MTLDDVSDELLAEYGLPGGGATAASYRCSDQTALLVPLAEVIGPRRMLNVDAVRSLLRGVRDGVELPPIVVFREPGAATAALLDGLHRWRVSLALGFLAIPATQPSRDDAELVYCYPPAGVGGSL